MEHRQSVLSVGILTLLFFTASLPSALAQGGSPDALYKDGRDGLILGDYEKAVKNFEQFVNSYPSNTQIFQVRLWLGQSYFYNGQFAEAIPVLKQLADDKTMAKPLRQDAMFFLGQAYLSQAGQVEGEDQKKAFRDSIKTFDTFIQEFPDAPTREDAMWNRGLCYFFLAEYDKAQAELKTLTETYPNSAMRAEHLYWYGYSFAAEATKAVAEGKPRSSVVPQAEKAYQLFDQIDYKSAPVPHNNAVLQKAELQLVMADPADRAGQVEGIRNALNTFREVKRADELKPVVNSAIDALQTQMAVAQRSDNTAEQDRISREMSRLKGVLGDMQNTPDPFTTAVLGMNRCFIYLQEYDASRVILNRLKEFEDKGLMLTDDMKKKIAFNDVLTLALIGRVDDATESLDDFESKFPGDPMLESIDFLIGAQLVIQGSNAIREAQAAELEREKEKALDFQLRARELFEAAVKRFQRSLEKFPKGRDADRARMSMADAYTSLGEPAKAEEKLVELLKDINDPALVPNVTFSLGSAQMSAAQSITDPAQKMAKFKQAAENFGKVLGMGAGEALKRNAAYQQGYAYHSAQMMPEAKAKLSEAIQKYPDQEDQPENEPLAKIFLAIIDISQGNKEAAAKTLLAIPDEHPDSPRAPFALGYLADNVYLQQREGIDKAEEVYEKLFNLYPDSQQARAGRLKLGQIFAGKSEWDRANTHFQALIETKDPEWVPFGLLQRGKMWQTAASAPGVWSALNEELQKTSGERYANSQSDFSTLLLEYPDSKVAKDAVDGLVGLISEKAKVGLMKAEEVVPFFQSLVSKADKPLAKARLTIGEAAVLYSNEDTHKEALATYDRVRAQYPDIEMTHEDISRYGQLLIDAERFDDARALFTRLQSYVNAPENKVPSATQQRSMAEVLYGLGMVELKLGKQAEAQKFFDELNDKYKWYPRISTVYYELAEIDLKRGNLDQAEEFLKKVISNTNSPQEISAKALVLRGDIYAKRDKFVPGIMLIDPEKPERGYRPDPKDPGNAASYYRKADLFYGNSQPRIGVNAAERYVEMIRKGLEQLSDKAQIEFWQKRLDEGIEHLVKTYPDSEEAAKYKTES